MVLVVEVGSIGTLVRTIVAGSPEALKATAPQRQLA